jgi:hypothetical protein
VIPVLSSDNLVLLAGEFLSPDEAETLASALQACAKNARREEREAVRLARAADVWAAYKDSSLPLGEVVGLDGRATPARLFWERHRWTALTPTSGTFEPVRPASVASIPPMLVRDTGARTRHWWAGTARALCGKLVDARPEAITKHTICATCATRGGLS